LDGLVGQRHLAYLLGRVRANEKNFVNSFG